MSEQVHKGLEGITVAESGLSHIDGAEGRLVYRGYDIDDLAEHASYEEVLHLLWYGHLPDADELASFERRMREERAVDPEVIDTVRSLAAADESPMAALRTTVSQLSAYDDDAAADVDPTDVEANVRKGRRLTAKLPTVVAAFSRLREGHEPVAPTGDLGHAAEFLHMLNGERPDDVLAEVFDMALVLHADHGINASTFSAMVTASTLADLHSAVTSAIGALGGGLHGGANQNVMRMLQAVDESDRDPVEWARRTLDEERRIPGFGHRVYEVTDPRARILGAQSERLGEAAGDTRWYEYSVALDEFMAEQEGLAPNVDFYSASTYYQMGIPVDVYTPIFAVARVGGWVAHVLEQYGDNRLIRPRARYTGDESREYVPLEDR
ncbi:citrate synthase [Halobacteriales archaeon SW_12_71_31]|nr:MAG: citrate synthase [Halobacteriales archaeon SW_12_71_31]